MKSIISNSVLARTILKVSDNKSKVSLRWAHQSCDLEKPNPKFWLNKIHMNECLTKELQNAWINLIYLAKEENIDLVENIAVNLVKLNCGYEHTKKQYPAVNGIGKEFPLHVASAFNDQKLVEFIIEKNMVATMGKNVNNGVTPLHYAGFMGNLQIVKNLIKCTVNPNAHNDYGWTPLHHAAWNGHMETVEALIGCTLNPNAPNRDGWTPIHYAGNSGFVIQIKKY